MTPDQQKAIALAKARQRRAEGARQDVSAVDAYNALPWYGQAAQAADDIVRATANGLTFGFADKIAGALSGEGTEAERQRSQQAQERAGLAYNAAQMAGGLRSALSAGNAGLTLIGRGAPATMTGLGGVLARTGVAGLEGAGYGALDALGNDTSVGMGAGLGALGGSVGNLIGEGVQAGVNAFRGQPAQNYVARSAQADAITPEIAQARLAELGPDAKIADLGPNLRGQTAAISTTPGEGQQIVRTALNDRNAGAAARMVGAVDDAMGAQQGVLSLADDIVNARSQAARPLYDVSRNVPVQMDDATKALLDRPSVKSAIDRATRSMQDSGLTMDLNKPTVGMIDAIKKELDDVIGEAVRAGRNNEVARLTGVKNSIVGVADKASPEYAQARKLFSDATTVKNALEDGQKIFSNSMSPEALTRHLSQLDESAREAYLIGARQQVANVMGTARSDAQAAKRLFGSGYNKEKLAIILDGDEAASRILNPVAAEEIFSATRNSAIGGSDTVPKALARESIATVPNSDGIIRSLLNLRPGDALSAAGNKVMGGVADARNERINSEIARILMSNDPSLLMSVPTSTAARDGISRALIGAQTGAY